MPLRSVAACLLTLAIGAAQAQSAPPPTTDAMPVAAEAIGSTRSATLRQLGVDYEMTLRGVLGSGGVSFGVRADELVSAATLQLKYSYSPALLAELSHIKVTVNGVTVATLPVDRAQAGRPLTADIAIDPRVIGDHNRINLQLVGHYTRDCEDPDHSSLWANIDASSTLSLTTTPLTLADDLALLPAPFFDARDARRLELPFHFARRPDPDTLQAAGIVSSWFGTLAGYRGARFPVSSAALPGAGNAVVLATPDTLPAALASGVGEIRGPMLAVLPNPTDVHAKLLLVLGRNAAELKQAATALALRAPVSGAVATIGELQQQAPRRPYDAPNWISSDRPVRFGELVERAEQLSVAGYHPDLIRVGLRLPPDLFVWESKGIPLDLKYRYTVPEKLDRSALNISINDAFVGTLPLDGRPQAASAPLRWWRGLGAQGRMPVEQSLHLPTGPFSASSELRFHFFFDRPQAGECQATFPDVAASIDADSSIDLSGFAHYMALPNLAAFGNAGFPFTRLADLSETSIVLPDGYGDADAGNVLTLLGRFGASTGYPALRATLATASAVEASPDRDLILLGSRRSQPLLSRWDAQLPVNQARGGERFVLSDWVREHVPTMLSFDARRTDLPGVAEVVLRPQGDDVLVMGFESPLHAGRSVVALQADDPSALQGLFDAWFDPQRLAQMQGSVMLLHDGKVTSLAGNQTYYVGHLPLPTWLRWHFSHHPVWLALAVLGLCLLLALAARVVLRVHTASRLRDGRHQ